MDLSPDTIMNLLVIVAGGVASLAVNAWIIIRYLDNRREAGDKELHSRINEVRREYVEKAQYDKDRERIEREFDRIEKTVTNGFAQMNERFDRVLAFLAPGSKGG